MSAVNFEKPETFNSLLKYMESDLGTHYFDYDEFEKTVFEVEGGKTEVIINYCETVAVMKREKIGNKVIEKCTKIPCEAWGYDNEYFTVPVLDCKFSRNYIYFAIRMLGDQSRRNFGIYYDRHLKDDEADMIVWNDKYLVIIAPTIEIYTWFECQNCNVIIEIKGMPDDDHCPLCGSDKWRWLTDD